MDDSILDSLAGFDAVWQRVSCHETPPRPQPAGREEDALLALIHDETCASAAAAALAKLFSGQDRALLLRHGAGSRRRLRRLRAEYFIRTGIMPPGNSDCRAVSGKLLSLRDAYLLAGRLAERYDAVGQAAADDETRALFAAFADEARLQARQLRALLVDSF